MRNMKIKGLVLLFLFTIIGCSPIPTQEKIGIYRVLTIQTQFIPISPGSVSVTATIESDGEVIPVSVSGYGSTPIVGETWKVSISKSGNNTHYAKFMERIKTKD